VLVPIIDRTRCEPALLMTVRASHLRRHAGQISFPGGRLEAEDVDVAAAAMRETAGGDRHCRRATSSRSAFCRI
jgi:8-oxo-dGTP pyrophosphatase MutT (NUDIX family)